MFLEKKCFNTIYYLAHFNTIDLNRNTKLKIHTGLNIFYSLVFLNPRDC